jgi:hypothetical protein
MAIAATAATAPATNNLNDLNDLNDLERTAPPRFDRLNESAILRHEALPGASPAAGLLFH